MYLVKLVFFELGLLVLCFFFLFLILSDTVPLLAVPLLAVKSGRKSGFVEWVVLRFKEPDLVKV